MNAVQENEMFSAFLSELSAQAIVKDNSNGSIVAIGTYAGQDGDIHELALPQHLLAVTETYPARWHDGRVLHTKQPGALSFVPGGFISQMRAQTPYKMTFCLLSPSFLGAVERELDHNPGGELHPRLNFHDSDLLKLISLLRAEATEADGWEQMYREHLTHALALRVLSRKRSMTAGGGILSPLPHRVLRRVVERMNELGDNLSVEELAKESGYSGSHFSRMFQAATGRTPHNYLTHLRLERAQELIRQHRVPLIDVALACGFSSHSHMTQVFRKLLGVTPSEYQRHLCCGRSKAARMRSA